MDHLLIAAVEKRVLAPRRIVDQLVRHHEVSGRTAADCPYRRDRNDSRRAAVLQRPQIGAVIDTMRRDRVTMPVASQEYGVLSVELSEDECSRRLSVRRAHHFPMRNRQCRQAREPGAANNCKHGTCLGGKFHWAIDRHVG